MEENVNNFLQVFDFERQSDVSCGMFHESSSDTKLSSWLREEFFLNE